MIVQKDFLNKLKAFGINIYEAKIWTALLSRGVSTAGELSDIANVPRSRSYDVLESLEKKGFVVMKIGKPIKYIAVPPEEVLERVKNNIREEAERTANSIDKIKDTELLTQLSTLHENGVEKVDPTELSGAIKGRDNIYDHLNLLIKEAKEKVIIATTQEGLVRKANALVKSIKKANKNGVRIQIAVPDYEPTEELAEIEKLAEIKKINLNARFTIVDDKAVLFMLTDDQEVHPNYDVGVWVNTGFFAGTLSTMIDKYWN